jgi:membrane-bound serine protease (ClpP class)
VFYISANIAFSALTAGLFLIYAELCAPGLVLPGSLGAIGVLGGGWVLLQMHATLSGILWLSAGIAFLACAILLRSYRMWAALAIICLPLGISHLLRGPDTISPALGIPLPVLWGVVTLVLARLALQGHARKRQQ